MSRPSTYVNWVPSGSSAYIQQPSAGQSTTGWVAGEAPPFQYMNWLFYYLDQWTQYLDGNQLNAAAYLLAADSTFLTTIGTVTSGSASMTNVPISISTTGNVTSGSDTITSVASTTNVVAGMSISGTGIPSNSKVKSTTVNTIVISQPATATNTTVSLTITRTLPKGTLISAANVTAGTYVVSTSGTTVTMSASATGSATGEAVSFLHSYAVADNVQYQLDQLDGMMYFNTFAPQIVTTSTILTTTGNITSGSNSIASLASTTNLAVGQAVSGTGIPSGSYVVTISGSTITISQNATATTTGVTLTFAHRYATATNLKDQLDVLDASISANSMGIVPFLQTTSSGSLKIAGRPVLQASFTLQAADTYTLDSGAEFIVLGDLTGLGTFVGNDTSVLRGI
jgi:hypothetical protein